MISQGLFPYLLASEIAVFLLSFFQSTFQTLPTGSTRLLINKAKSCPRKQPALTLQHRKLQHPFLSRIVVVLWQQSSVIFQTIGESSDSHIPDHVFRFVIQPLTLLHADVSSSVNIRVLKKYWLSELMEYISSFLPLFLLFAQYRLYSRKQTPPS